MSYRKIGFVTGLQFEARLIERAAKRAKSLDRILTSATAGRSVRVQECVQHLVDDGAEALISFGVAGGLSPALKSGALVLGTSVVCDGQRYFPDFRFRNGVANWLDRSFEIGEGPVCHSDHVVAEPDEKDQLFKSVGAVCVDMESGPMCRVASELGVPAVIVRIIADEAADRIPALALKGMSADGEIQAGHVLAGLAREPGESAALVKFSRKVGRANRQLGRVARSLGLFLASL